MTSDDLRKNQTIGADLPEDMDPSLAFDLDAFDRDDALRAESERKPIPVKMGGKWIAFPQTSDWPYEATDLLDGGDMIGALRIVFDPSEARNEEEKKDRRETLVLLEELADKRMSVISALFEHLSEKSGVGLGESNRSTRRSRSSRRR